jgi:HEAT repeat protein
MEPILNFFNTREPWVLIIIIPGAVAVIAIAVLLVRNMISRNRFYHTLREIIDGRDAETILPEPKVLLKRTKIIERFAREKGTEIIFATGIDRLWLDRLREKRSESDLHRVLEFLPEKGLFTALLAAIENPGLEKTVFNRIGGEPGFMRKMALSGSGESFDGAKALKIFSSRMDEIREISGDPEWTARYFAIKLMLHDNDPKSLRALEEGFQDPHPLVRKTISEEITQIESKQLYDKLRDLLLHDPSFEVRQAAYKRISSEFKDKHVIKYEELEGDEALHVLDFLEPDSDEDINTALQLLSGNNHELRLPSALFLQSNGVLADKLAQVSFQDRENLERTSRLLMNAAEVQVCGFLKAQNLGPGAQYVSLNILKNAGERTLIAPVASAAFAASGDNAREVWESAVDAICLRGTEEAFSLLMRELNAVRSNSEKSEYILNKLPGEFGFITLPLLLELLRDDRFGSREALREAFSKLQPELVLPEVFRIIKSGRKAYSHRVRINALQVLAWYRLPYCLQPVLEQLPILPLDEAGEFTKILAEYGGKNFDSRVSHLLKQPDGRTRAAIIASLPGANKKTFMKEIRDALKDADPDVRIAALMALADFEETKTVNQAFNMMRDPVERVRIAAAKTFGTFGTPANIKRFQGLLSDENEVESVKLAALKGLSTSIHPEAVDVLVKFMDEDTEFSDAAANALSSLTHKKALIRLVEQMKDAEPTLREKISRVFKKMGVESEKTIRELLTEDIPSLHDYLVEILDSTGYTESIIRKLSHRDPGIRRDAADFLSRVGSKAAFRGMVLAARDPDDEVRVKVTKALEVLASKGGKEILEELKNDPERRVRKFTLWAMERIRARELVD